MQMQNKSLLKLKRTTFNKLVANTVDTFRLTISEQYLNVYVFIFILEFKKLFEKTFYNNKKFSQNNGLDVKLLHNTTRFCAFVVVWLY